VTTLAAYNPLTDSPIATTLTDLATCLCSQIVADGLPDVCFCGIIPGEAASAMYGGDCTKKCGMAWVRLVTSYMAAGAGNAVATPGNCMTGIGFDVEMGMLRCTPIGEATSPPSPAELLASAQLQWADMMVMRKAVACCPGHRDWALGAYTPMGPGGGLVGGFWVISMWVP
jgi:hypothetical protein